MTFWTTFILIPKLKNCILAYWHIDIAKKIFLTSCSHSEQLLFWSLGSEVNKIFGSSSSPRADIRTYRAAFGQPKNLCPPDPPSKPKVQWETVWNSLKLRKTLRNCVKQWETVQNRLHRHVQTVSFFALHSIATFHCLLLMYSPRVTSDHLRR